MDSDELKNAQATMKERYSHPKINRLDKRANNGLLEQERQRVRELQAIKREKKKIIKSLKAADDVQSKRLLWDILDKEDDRLQGRPHTATPPPKPSTSNSSGLQERIQKLVFSGEKVNPTAEPSPEPSEPVLDPPIAEPEPSHEDMEKLMADLREISRIRN
jgi:hypothetical protein